MLLDLSALECTAYFSLELSQLLGQIYIYKTPADLPLFQNDFLKVFKFKFQNDFQGKHVEYQNMPLCLSITQVKIFSVHVEANLHNLLSMAIYINILVALHSHNKKFHS